MQTRKTIHRTMFRITPLLLGMLLGACTGLKPESGGDWPIWGGSPSRNMVAHADNIPHVFKTGEFVGNSEEIDMSTTENVRWIAKLGSQCYGNVAVSKGKIFVGTNNEAPRDPRHTGDRGNIYCLDEATGEFLWQLVVPKIGAGKVSDWEYLGICSSPAVDDNRVYVVTNRCELVCLDTEGVANGNDGPFLDEGQYMAGLDAPPMDIGPTDADILWVYDMREELGIFPHNIASNSAMIIGDTVYVATSNGVDWSHSNVPQPNAPVLIGLDKLTGDLVGEDVSGVSSRMFHCNWSSPSFGKIKGKPQLVFGAGDGICYGFNPKTELFTDEYDESYQVFPEIWHYDCNPPSYRKLPSGKPVKYATPKGPSEIIGTPVIHEDRVYVAIGQDPEHGQGLGNLVCIDASKTGDITHGGRVWEYQGIDRTISTVSIADGLVFTADYAGVIHCLEAGTGKLLWTHDTLSHIWGSTLVADGKVFIGNEDGYLIILRAGREKELIAEIEFPSPIYSTPVVANDVLYIATQTHLYAVQADAP
jgi:outer membrane protein assembly factor BamB